MPSMVFQHQTPETNIPSKGTVDGLVSKILGSANPQETFNSMLSQNRDAKTAMDICNQYGNGDPKTAFFNYAREKGQNNLANSIMKRLGLS